jgi:hypothetical protein
MLINKSFWFNFLALSTLYTIFSIIIYLLPFEKNEYFILNTVLFGSNIFITFLLISYQLYKKESSNIKRLRIDLVNRLKPLFVVFTLVYALLLIYVLEINFVFIVYLSLLLLNGRSIYAIWFEKNIYTDVVDEYKSSIQFHNDLSIRLNGLKTSITETSVLKKLNALIEEVKYSDPKSIATVRDLEKNLLELVRNLEKNLKDSRKVEDLINELDLVLLQRNQLLKSSKN